MSRQRVDESGRRIYDHAWRQVRERVLERDGRWCQLHLPGCTGEATQVDHIVPVSDGGARLDPVNLRASCASCNQRRGGRFRAAGRFRDVFEAGRRARSVGVSGGSSRDW